MEHLCSNKCPSKRHVLIKKLPHKKKKRKEKKKQKVTLGDSAVVRGEDRLGEMERAAERGVREGEIETGWLFSLCVVLGGFVSV